MQVTNLILALILLSTSLGVGETHRMSYRKHESITCQDAELAEAHRLNTQVVKLFEEGRYDEALPLAKRVLEIREKALGMNNQPVAEALNNLATIYMQQKRYDQAETFFKSSLTVYEKLNDSGSLIVATIIENLGVLRYQKRAHDQAEALFLRSLSIREKAFGTDHANLLQYLHGLGNFYRIVGRYDKAAAVFQRIVGIKERSGLPEHSELGEALEDYACALREADRKIEAREIEERVSRIFYSPADMKDAADKSGDVLNAKAISLPQPQFPGLARFARKLGTVRVRILIDESGKVLKACAVDGPEIFHDVSTKAALDARFTPTVKDGKPVKVIGLVAYNFKIGS